MRDLAALANEEADLRLVVMGEFSSGKSTLVNALVGRDVMKTAATVETAHLSVLRFGEPELANLHMHDGKLCSYPLTEGLDLLARQGQHSALLAQLDRAELTLNVATLRDMQVADTPGLSTVFEDHEALTQEVLRQSNCILWVFDANQAGTGTERDYLRRLEGRCVLGVLNKADDLDDDEIGQVVTAARTVAPDTLLEVLPVSAYDAREAQRTHDPDRLARSGLPALEAFLQSNVDTMERLARDVARQSRLKEAVLSLHGLIASELAGLRAALARWHDVEEVLTQRREVLLERVERDLVRANQEHYQNCRQQYAEKVAVAPTGHSIQQAFAALGRIEEHVAHATRLKDLATSAFQEEWIHTAVSITEMPNLEVPADASPSCHEADQCESGWARFSSNATLAGAIAGMVARILTHLPFLGLFGSLAGGAISSGLRSLFHSGELSRVRAAAQEQFFNHCQRFEDSIKRGVVERLMPALARESRKVERAIADEFSQTMLGGQSIAAARRRQDQLMGLATEVDSIAASSGLRLPTGGAAAPQRAAPPARLPSSDDAP